MSFSSSIDVLSTNRILLPALISTYGFALMLDVRGQAPEWEPLGLDFPAVNGSPPHVRELIEFEGFIYAATDDSVYRAPLGACRETHLHP